MKKRFLNLFLAVAMIICVLPMAASAVENCTIPWGHDWKDGVCGYCMQKCDHAETSSTTTEATCATTGTVTEICKECGETVSVTVLEKSNVHTFMPNYEDGMVCRRCGANKQDVCEHEYETTSETSGNCMVPGTIEETCKLCGKVNTRDTVKNADVHQGFINGKCACGYECKHTETRNESVEANCAEEGYSKDICKTCGKVVTETVLNKTNTHVFLGSEVVCRRCGANKQDVCEHEYEIVDEEAGNCVNPGYVWETCKLCGKEHNHETELDSNVHQGFVNDKCVCGFVCTHTETRSESVESTCAAEGYIKEICKTCGKVTSETVLEKSNEHVFLNNEEVCRRCGAALQDVCEHDYEIVKAEPGNCTLTGYAWEVCKLCGKEYNHETAPIPSAHNFVNGRCATCFKPCECDMEYVDSKAANCNEEGYNRIRCLKCDKILFETILEKNNDHLFAADYEDGKKCSRCGANLQDVCEHDYTIVKEEPGTCAEAGYVWKECKLCGKESNHETTIDPDGHVYKTLKWELPSCEEPGHIWLECTLCGYKEDREDGAAMGHQYENGKCYCGEPDPNCPHTNHVEDMSLYRPATCTVDGVHVYNCPNCGTQQREAIPMLGHERVEKKVDATCTTNGLRIVSCTRCKQLLEEETLNATGHSYVDGKCACGAVDPVTICKHPQNMQSTHTQAATCTVDGYTIVTCNGCDTILSKVTLAAKGHTGETTVHAPTCTENGAKIETCTTCHAQLSYQKLSATGHNYVNGICSACGTTDPNKYTSDFQDIFIVG